MTIGTRLQARRATAAAWTSANPTLLAGELGFETDTGKIKIGNGSTAWNSLAYGPAGTTPATHTHAESDVTSLVADLAAKAASSHTHVETDIANLTADRLTTGESNIDRALAVGAPTLANQTLRLGYFTARKTETVTQVYIRSVGAAGATPTLVRVGVWTANAAGALLSSVATTPNDTALLAGATTDYTKSFSASFSKTAGTRYAVGILVVTGATAPTIVGSNTAQVFALMSRSPILAGQITGQTDLPSTAVSGSISAVGPAPYFELLP